MLPFFKNLLMCLSVSVRSDAERGLSLYSIRRIHTRVGVQETYHTYHVAGVLPQAPGRWLGPRVSRARAKCLRLTA